MELVNDGKLHRGIRGRTSLLMVDCVSCLNVARVELDAGHICFVFKL